MDKNDNKYSINRARYTSVINLKLTERMKFEFFRACGVENKIPSKVLRDMIESRIQRVLKNQKGNE